MRLKVLTLIFILSWCGLFLSQKINLATADLGRHVKNGEIIIQASWAEKAEVLKTNFYSYTMPEAEFVNHHWLSGVIFYAVERMFGFTGLSLLYVLGSILAILLFFNVARRVSSFYTAAFVAIILTPLLVSRAEVRPEMWSYLLPGVFLNLLYFRKHLWSIPILMMFWVNLHIGFIFGFLVLGSFILEDYKKFWKVTLASVLLGLVNPFGYKMFLYPFLIFENYGYKIVENQSIHFLENLGFGAGEPFMLYKIVAGAVLVSIAALIYKKVKISPSIIIPTVATGVLAYLGIRHFPSFALFTLPFLSYAMYKMVVTKFSGEVVTGLSVVVLALSLTFGIQDLIRLGPVLGWGLSPGVLEAAEFYKTNNLKGPIFNNYDVGGYLIYALPQEKVFVDNRPEAYSEDFFAQVYVPAQEDDSVWQKLDEQYKFNTIFFSHRDYTPWGQEFLATRLKDKDWKTVFLDDYIIIFSKVY